MMRRARLVLALALGCAWVPSSYSPAWAQGTQAVLDVRTASGQSTFRIGERIPLELSFSASEDKRYEITLASYDRSGRMSYEDFGVSPETGWVDPLADYFA